MDPVCEAALATFRTQEETLRGVVAGLSDEALNWSPAPEANSIAVLVAHAWGAAQAWTARAAGREIERDRSAEFRVRAGAEALDQLLAEGLTRIEQHLGAVEPALYATRWSGPGGEELSRAACLLHAMEHAQEHVGQALLTRQLWEGR